MWLATRRSGGTKTPQGHSDRSRAPAGRTVSVRNALDYLPDSAGLRKGIGSGIFPDDYKYPLRNRESMHREGSWGWVLISASDGSRSPSSAPS
jgi:hypothetical protein